MDALPSQELPPGWAVASLGDLIDGIEAGKNVAAICRPPEDGETGIVKVSAVTWGEFDEDESKALHPGTEIDPADLIRPGDFLISRANTIELVGAPVIVKQFRRRLVLSDKVLRLRVVEGFDRWLELFLKSHFGRTQIEQYATGAQLSMRNISQENLRRIAVPVAPRDEQERIVAAVNALFEEVEAGEAALARAREGLTQFRASLLHAACTGALTADWRAANPTDETGGDMLAAILRRRQRLWEHGETARGRRPSAYAGPAEAVAGELPSLPAGWTWATVAQLSFVSGGLTKNASRNDSPMQLPYLRVANVGEDRIDLTDLRKIGVTEGELPRIALLPGDLLFVEGNGSADQIGRVALWSGQVRPCVHQNHLIKARPVRRFLGRWMRDWFMSPLGKQFVQAAASSTSGLHTLSISKIEALPVPSPPAAELRRILPRCAEMKREHADGALVLDQQLDALSSLRQSILHAAFTGRLVPQDPADEPAAALLARLRATPAAARRPRARRNTTQPDLIETPA